jgi:hypothetical protein
VRDSLRGSLAGGTVDTLPGLPARPVQPVQVRGRLAGDLLTISLQLNYQATAAGPTITVAGRRGQAATSDEAG